MCNMLFCLFYQVSLNPVQILNQGAEEERAETARLVSYKKRFAFDGNFSLLGN